MQSVVIQRVQLPRRISYAKSKGQSDSMRHGLIEWNRPANIILGGAQYLGVGPGRNPTYFNPVGGQN
jgi:hypothetical protein